MPAAADRARVAPGPVRRAGRLNSMTGFGRGNASVRGVKVTVEIRGTNQRFLRVGVKLPARLSALEPRLRSLLEAGPRRGQIDAVATVEGFPADGELAPDLGLVRAYVEAWRKVGRALGLEGDIDLRTLAAMPQLFVSDPDSSAAEKAWPAVEAAARAGLEAFDRMRAAEGASLARDLRRRLERIGLAARRIAARCRVSQRLSAKRLRERVKALLGEMGSDAARVSQTSLERELAILASRADVSEELERIESHIRQFRETLGAGSPAGRKLEFLLQELQREISTLGAKVSDAAAAREAVEFRAELEKMREQVQNVE